MFGIVLPQMSPWWEQSPFPVNWQCSSCTAFSGPLCFDKNMFSMVPEASDLVKFLNYSIFHVFFKLLGYFSTNVLCLDVWFDFAGAERAAGVTKHPDFFPKNYWTGCQQDCLMNHYLGKSIAERMKGESKNLLPKIAEFIRNSEQIPMPTSLIG